MIGYAKRCIGRNMQTVVDTGPISSSSQSASSSVSCNDSNSNLEMTSKVKLNEVDPSAYTSSNSEDSLDKLLQVSVILLRQAIDLVDESLCDDAQLTYVSKFISGSTIGKHLRHATDHFSLLLDSVSSASASSTSSLSDPVPSQSAQKDLELNYDVRARGTPMESSRASARAALEGLITHLQKGVVGVERDRTVRLTAVTPYVQTFKTSFGRELWFAALHAIHHWSMIRVIAGELDVQLDDAFGLAPSTLVYQGIEAPLGKAKI